MCPYVTERPDI
ncbi:hypothetical protein RRG08_047342 [Elysia crispata]|uniref:Uncharacterized protein n=1 Tax=Elysia crispata TaxID=231223 RepID=A0AAE1A1S2_9GAST|nr:hypothetical protein RRG08_047342 [Elysia crispata]